MTCSTGACAVNASGQASAVARIPRHCCEECAQDAIRSHPVLRSLAKPSRGLVIVPQRVVAVGGRELAPVMDYPSARPMAVIAPPSGARLPRGAAGSTHAVLGIKPSGRTLRFPGSIGTGPRTPVVHDRGSRGRFPMVTGVTFLEVMGWSPAGWCGLTRGEKLHVAKAFELANPGTISHVGVFVRDLDTWCASHGYRPLRKPSGDISIPSGLTGADWVPYGTSTGGWAIDDLGNYVSIDSSGHPIQGTVRETADPNSTPISDSDLDLGSLEFVSGSDSGDGGARGGSSARQPDANTRAAWQAVNSLIGAAGTDIAALITAGNRTELANINANLQLALRNGQSPTTGQSLTPAQIAQLQQVNGFLNPKPAISTPVAVGGGVILAAVLAKALDWI